MRETLSINKLYMTVLLIGIVVAPIYWLMFTTDGKRRTDTMILWLFSGESIEINFEALDNQFREEDWKTVYPELQWQCKETQSPFGQKVCFTEIASYNGIPSRYLSVFFVQQHTSAVKLVYRDQYHSDIGDDLVTQLGQPDNSTTVNSANASAEQVLQWNTKYGAVLIKQALQRAEEPVLLWLAKNNLPAG